ncbi:MAG: hypothetical protein K2J64_07930, partial [Desulfovibrio sp.]|nr:hypothetical protein [Desulfovibrio sp.]
RGPLWEGGRGSDAEGETPATLALRALGLPASPSTGTADGRALREACLFLLGWRIGLPGLAFVSPQELTGALAAQGGGEGLTPVWEAVSGHAGTAQALRLAFGTLAEQEARADSFVRAVGRLLLARKASGLALGRLVAVSGGQDGWLAALSALPEGGMWLTVGNASPKRRTLTLPLPESVVSAADAAEASPGLAPPRLGDGGRSVEVELDARQCRHVLLRH